MSKLLQISLFIFLMGLGKNTIAQNTTTPVDKNSSKVEEKKKMNLDEHEKARNAYLNSSIHSTTARKDSLLSIYGTFEAARKAGALVRRPTIKTTNLPNKK